MNKDDTMGGLKREAEELPSSDAAYAPATAMTIEDIQREGERMWAGPDGNIGSKVGAASSLPQSTQAQTAVFPQGDSADPEAALSKQIKESREKRDYEAVTKRAAEIKRNPNEANRGAKRDVSVGDEDDEVSPTQSDPPDNRSDNLMTPESEGIADETSYNSRMYNQHPEAFTGHDKVDLVEWAREEEEEKGHDDLVQGSEAMEVGEHFSDDSTSAERTSRKEANSSKVSQSLSTRQRGEIAEEIKYQRSRTHGEAEEEHLKKYYGTR